MVRRRRTAARLADRTGTACRAEAVSKVYGRRETAVHALRDVTLDISSGAFTAIMGPSGSGKSTLLHCLAALDTPTAGQVFLGRTELTALSRRQQAQVRRDRIGFVFQAFNLVPTLDAIENITLPQLLAGRRPDREWLDHIVRQIGLADRLHHRPSELSGGQQQRVALARALAGRPEVIFADEPTGNLDTAAGQEMLALLRDAVDQFEQTVITVSHDPSIARYADRVLFLRDGQVVDQAHRPDVDQVLERLRFSDGVDAGPDELHAPRPDGQDTMRSRRRRQPDEPAPGRPMVGSDDEVEVARQERWLQRIREQFEAEQHARHDVQQPAEADPWATEPAIEREAQPPTQRRRAEPVDDRHDDTRRRGEAMPSPPADPAPAGEDWLPPMRSWDLRTDDADAADGRAAPPPPAWHGEQQQDEAPWSRPGTSDEHEEQQATTSQWAPPDSDWPPLERGPSGHGWRTDTGDRPSEPRPDLPWAQHDRSWSPPEDDDGDPWAPRGERRDAPVDDRWRSRGRADWRAVRDAGWPPEHDNDEPTAHDARARHRYPDNQPPPDATRPPRDTADEQPVRPSRYPSWQPGDDRDDVNGFHQPDAPPQSPSRNGLHHDDQRDMGPHRNGRPPSARDERPDDTASADRMSDEGRPPSADDADRVPPRPLDDPWSNVWDASSGIDVADTWSSTLDHGAVERGGPRGHGPASPAAEDPELSSHGDGTDAVPAAEPGAGEDEIVQPVLRPTAPADDRPAIPRLDEPTAAAPVAGQPATPEPSADQPAAADPVPQEPVVPAPVVDERVVQEPVDDQRVEDEPTTRPAAPAAPQPADRSPIPAPPALADEPAEDVGTQPLPALAEVAHQEPDATPTAAEPRAADAHADRPRPGARGGDAAGEAQPRRRHRPEPRVGDTDLPAALASLRSTRRPDETTDPTAALASLQAQLDRLGTVDGRPGARQPRRPGRDRPTPRRDRD